MAIDDETIAQFVAIAVSSEDTARSFLTQADGNLETALQNYFAAGSGDGAEAGAGDLAMDLDPATAAPPAAAAPAAPSGPRTLSGAPAPPAHASWGSSASSKPASKPGRSTNTDSRIRGFADLASSSGPSRGGGGGGGHAGHGHGDDDDDDDDDDDEPERLYAGGERSGLSVENPDSKPGGKRDLVKNLLKQAAEGSRRRAANEPEAPLPSGPTAFGGSGNRLGSADDPVPGSESEIDPSSALPGHFSATGTTSGSATPSGSNRNPNIDLETPVRRTLTFWSDGFSIEDGPLMGYNDPQHAEALQQLTTGRAPLSLLNVAQNQRVDVVVADRRREAYEAPKPAPFSGGGNRLGSIVPGGAEAAFAPPAPASASTSTSGSGSGSGSGGGSARAPGQSTNIAFEVDGTKPTTRLQVILFDGSRFPVTVNQDHTIADVRRLVDAGNRGNSTRPYNLWLRMPKRLLDDKQTVKEAGALNAVVVQTAI